MNCRACQRRLPAVVDEPDLAVAAHLRDCPVCRAEWERLRRVAWLLDTDPAPAAEDLRALVWARLEPRPAELTAAAATAWRQAVPALLAVSLLFGLTAVYVWSRWPVPLPNWAALGRAAGEQAAGWLDLLGATLLGLGEMLVAALSGLRLTALPGVPSSLLIGSALAALVAELLTRRAAPVAVRNGGRGGG